MSIIIIITINNESVHLASFVYGNSNPGCLRSCSFSARNRSRAGRFVSAISPTQTQLRNPRRSACQRPCSRHKRHIFCESNRPKAMCGRHGINPIDVEANHATRHFCSGIQLEKQLRKVRNTYIIFHADLDKESKYVGRSISHNFPV